MHFRTNQTQQQYESKLQADRESYANMPEPKRKERSAAIAAKAKFKRQAEDEITATERKKLHAARYRGLEKKKRYDL